MSQAKDYVVRLSGITEERNVTAPMCKMHFEKQPMKIAKASKQYLYDDMGYEFLDCSANIAHVGHCHPHVVFSGQKQMTTLAAAEGYVTEAQSSYAKNLLALMPGNTFDTVLFVNSGSEANDLAIRLAQAYTNRKDVICHQPSTHGHLSTLSHLHYQYIRVGHILLAPLPILSAVASPAQAPGYMKADWIHHIPVCDTYRGEYADCDDPGLDAVSTLKTLLLTNAENNHHVACFVTEAIHTLAGNIVPPENYLPNAVRAVHDAGGLVIFDEVSSGLGRFGTHWWAYEHVCNVSPDIVVAGRSLANGQPLACVITNRAIAKSLPFYSNTFGGNPVSCAMGNAVLEVMQNEHLLESCGNVGKALLKGFHEMQERHPNLGDIRGMGLSIVLEISQDKTSRKPDPEVAEKIAYRLRDHYRILVPVDGPETNCLFINPPMCFSLENAETLIRDIDLAITDVEENRMESVKSLFELTEMYQIPDDIFNLDTKKRSADSPSVDEGVKKARYEELD